jgi:hypothetical protein
MTAATGISADFFTEEGKMGAVRVYWYCYGQGHS